MIWVLIVLLAAGVLLGSFLVITVRRVREELSMLQQTSADRESQIDALEQSAGRAHVERSKINTRASDFRSTNNKRLDGYSKIINEQRSVVAGHGRGISAARTDISINRAQLDQTNRTLRQLAKTSGDLPSSAALIEKSREDLIQAALDLPAAGPHEQRADFTALLRDGDPDVSVVVTSFDDERFVLAALRSLVAQSLSTWECVIVDDASTDSTVATIESFIKGDHRFQLIEHTANLGPAAARNTGIEAARAPFICFLDADDLLLRLNLEERLERFLGIADMSVAAVFSGVGLCPEDTELTDLPDSMPWTKSGPRDYLTMGGENPFAVHAPLLRTDVVQRTGGFDPSLRSGTEDWKFWTLLMRNGYRFIPCSTTLAMYRQKSSGRHSWKREPVAHLRAAKALLADLDERIPQEMRLPGSPFFFEKPLDQHQSDIRRAKRELLFLGAAAGSLNKAQLAATLAEMSVTTIELSGHINLSNHLRAGICRSLGLTPQDHDELASELVAVESGLVRLIKSQLDVADDAAISFPATISKKRSAPLALFWWRAAAGAIGKANFGDELSPLLVHAISGREVVWAAPDSCKLAAVGSVMEHLLRADHDRPWVWGSGFLRDGISSGAGLNVLATRGRLSNERAGNIGAVGDPALLSRYLNIGEATAYRVGLLPHYVDWGRPFCQEFLNEVDGAVLIDPLQPPLDVLAQIAACDVIFSSSLHGLICADSLGIANAWVELSNDVVGNGYKFADYYSCFDITPAALRPNHPGELDALVDDVISSHARPQINQLCADLLDAFPFNV